MRSRSSSSRHSTDRNSNIASDAISKREPIAIFSDIGCDPIARKLGVHAQARALAECPLLERTGQRLDGGNGVMTPSGHAATCAPISIPRLVAASDPLRRGKSEA